MSLLGFSSGLPLLLINSTLAFWLKKLGLDYTSIAVFSLTGFPYAFKFLWAPFVDRLKLPYLHRLGQRRSWLILSQIILFFCLLGLGLINPTQNLAATATLALVIACAGATQDIVILACQVECLPATQYGAGEAMGMFGYRMGMLLASAGALSLSTTIGWSAVYRLMACMMLIGLATSISLTPSTCAIPTKARVNRYIRKFLHSSIINNEMLASLHLAIITPFIDFMKRPTWLYTIIILFFYKIGDNLIGNLHNIFYADLGFNEITIASASKVFGMLASILGGFLGGVLLHKHGVIKSLLYFGSLHALSLLTYLTFYYTGANVLLLYFCVGLEHITGGMRLTALFAFQLSNCNRLFAATQLALFSSIIQGGRVIFSSCSGWIVDHYGWPTLFIISAISMLPVLLLIYRISDSTQPVVTQRFAY